MALWTRKPKAPAAPLPERPEPVEKVAKQHDTGDEKRRLSRLVRIVATVATAEAGVIMMGAAVIYHMLPLTREVPLFLTVTSDEHLIYRVTPFTQDANALAVAIDGWSREWVCKRYAFRANETDRVNRLTWLKNWTEPDLFKADIDSESYRHFVDTAMQRGYERTCDILTVSHPQPDWYVFSIQEGIRDKSSNLVESQKLEVQLRYTITPGEVRASDLRDQLHLDYLNPFNYRVVEHRNRILNS